MNAVRACSLLLASSLLISCASAGDSSPTISFKKTQLDNKFRSEGVAVGDFNHDGKLDIATGGVYYAAPDWKMVAIVAKPKEIDPHGYSESFQNYAADVNGDGRTDLIVVEYPGKDTVWFEQPAEVGTVWKRHVITPITNNESPAVLDLDGDGKGELLLAFDPGKHIGYAKVGANPAELWTLVPVSEPNASGTDRFSHGIGAGDINGDGRLDILVTDGWWECPAESRESRRWTFHRAKFGEPCAQMHVYDFDGDGRNDVLTSSAHKHGIWWHQQTPSGWVTHEIDKSFSQSHSLCLADINGDKLPDFVTGKRWWAHGPKGDPDSDKPAVLYWYELSRKDGKPAWTRHQIDDDSGVGTQFQVADVNGDGLLDIAIGNKKGAFYFEQVRK